MIIIKKILLLEDELSVVSRFVDIIEKNNSNTFLNNDGILLSLSMDSSTIGNFDLNDFDYIFVDRDNALNKEGSFHKYYLEMFEKSSGSLLEITKRTYPMSGSIMNNDYLNNEIIKILINSKKGVDDKGDVEYYIGDRETQNEIENILKSNYLTKSFDTFIDKLNALLNFNGNTDIIEPLKKESIINDNVNNLKINKSLKI